MTQTPPVAGDIFAPVMFYAFAALTVGSAWAIVFSRNIVRTSVYLLFALGGAAGLYFLLQAELLAALQLIVYAGGTLILIVFGVMLTSQSLAPQIQASRRDLWLGGLIGLAIAAALAVAIAKSNVIGSKSSATGYANAQIIGKELLSSYLAPFEVAAVLLLVVMIAAAYMARRRK